MNRVFTLMTAMPPTKGHLHLIEFVHSLSDDVTHGRVIVTTQPDEPMAAERYHAVRQAAKGLNVDVFWLNRELPVDPNTPGFWMLWKSLMMEHGMEKGDVFVSSELYGATMAEVMKGTFIPYDPARELLGVKATPIRENMVKHFGDIMPTFQPYLRGRVTIFGAESTGKTTLSRELAAYVNGDFLYEYARPYLEAVGPEITIKSMENIWKGQKAAQDHTRFWEGKPFLIQDTDLFSTVGYWEQPHWKSELGEVPPGLVKDAQQTKSDLYLILKSDIPFEKDPIRYGGDRRESPDEYWIGLADKYNLNYQVIEAKTLQNRIGEAAWAVRKLGEDKNKLIAFDRKGF